jgi:hypothetical protein
VSVIADCEAGKPVVARCPDGRSVDGVAQPVLAFRKMGSVAVPPAPGGLQQVMATELQLQPLDTPNYVDLILHYSDGQVPVSEGGLRAFYYHEILTAWVELPVTVDPVGNAVTVQNVDVSAFAAAPRWLGLFA